MSDIIFRTLAGSRLYGVETDTSDYDFKGIYLESLPDLLDKKDNTRRNVSGNIEEELFSLNYYMKLLAHGQVIPVDMLFAPKEFWSHSSEAWELIHSERHSFVSSNIVPFVGYAKGQAMKYGLKGNKIKTIEKALELVKNNTPFDELCDYLYDREYEGIEIYKEKKAQITHISICGKSFGSTTDYKLWLEPLEKLLLTFGERAKLAADGVDLKAQYHTLRICYEAIELLTTGNLTFPRPEAPILKDIRNGFYSQELLESLVESKFFAVKEAEKTTSISKYPDFNRMKEIVLETQKNYIVNQS